MPRRKILIVDENIDCIAYITKLCGKVYLFISFTYSFDNFMIFFYWLYLYFHTNSINYRSFHFCILSKNI